MLRDPGKCSFPGGMWQWDNVKTELGQTLSLSCFFGVEPSIAAFFPSDKGVKSLFLWDHGEGEAHPLLREASSHTSPSAAL